MFGTQHRDLSQKGFEHLSGSGIGDSERAGDETIRPFAIKENFEVAKVIFAYAVIREVNVFEVEVPIVVFAIGVPGEKVGFRRGKIVEAFGIDVGVQASQSTEEFLII